MNPTTDNRIIFTEGALPPIGSDAFKQAQQGIVPTGFTNAISSANITPQTPFSLPTTQPSSVAPEIIQTGGTSSKSITTQTAEETKRRQELEILKTQQSDIKGSLTGILGELGIQGQKTVQAEEQAGIPQKQRELDEITSQIEARTLAARRQTEIIEKQTGLTEGQKNVQIRESEKEAAREIADLSIIQNARNRNLLTAQSLVNKKIELQTEDLKNRFNYLKFFYDENKGILDKADQRAFEAEIKKADRIYNEEREKVKTLENSKLTAIQLAIKNGADQATLQNIQNAETPEAAFANIGTFGENPVDRELKKLEIDYKRKQISLLGEPTAKEQKEAESALKESKASIPVMKDKIETVDALKEHSGLNTRVGTSILTRTPKGFWGTLGKAATIIGIPALTIDAVNKLTGSGQDFAGGVHKLVGGLTLQSLIDAKNRGATFGALSDAELNILANSATAISDWELKDDSGKGLGIWNIDQKSFKEELDTIKNLTNRAIMLSEGSLVDKEEDSALDNMFNTEQFISPSSYYK